MIITAGVDNRGLKSRDPQGSDRGEPTLGEAPAFTWRPTKYEYDGALFGCPGKCGIFDLVLSRLVTPEEVMAERKFWREKRL